METRKLDKAVLKLWYIRALVAIAVMVAAFAVALFLIEDLKIRLVVAISAGIPELVAIAFILILPYLRFKMFEYGYDDKQIFVRQGVIFRHKVVIPVCQIQDLHREQGPLMLILGLGAVTISTAGSNFTLSCLKTEDADRMIEELRVSLEKRIEESGNEKI